MTATKRITIQATRFDPDKDDKPRLQSYDIPFSDDSMVVLDALNYIKGHVDGSLSYRWSCRMGICGSCGMMVDGVPKLTCNAFLRDYWPKPITVEPLNNFPIVRDLVIDMDDFMHKLKAIKPWIIRKQPVPLGRDGTRPALQPRLARRRLEAEAAGARRRRGRVGVQLRRRVLGRVPEGRRPREGDPADQARHHHAVRPPVRRPRLSAYPLPSQ